MSRDLNLTITDDNGNPIWATFIFSQTGQKYTFTDIYDIGGKHFRLGLSHPTEGKNAGKYIISRENSADEIFDSMDDVNNYIKSEYKFEAAKLSDLYVDNKPLVSKEINETSDIFDKKNKQMQSDFEQSDSEMQMLKTEILEANPDFSNEQLANEIAWRLINDFMNLHGFDSQLEGRAPNHDEYVWKINSDVLEQKDFVIQHVAEKYLNNEIVYDDIQNAIDSELKNNELYKELQLKGYLTDFCDEKVCLDLENIYKNFFDGLSINRRKEVIKQIYNYNSDMKLNNGFIRCSSSNDTLYYDLYQNGSLVLCTGEECLKLGTDNKGNTYFMAAEDNAVFSLSEYELAREREIPLSEFAKRTDKEAAEVLWFEFGNVTVDDDGCIDSDWLDFPAGTDREEIWHWFEEHFDDVSVGADLMDNNISYEEYQNRRWGRTSENINGVSQSDSNMRMHYYIETKSGDFLSIEDVPDTITYDYVHYDKDFNVIDADSINLTEKKNGKEVKVPVWSAVCEIQKICGMRKDGRLDLISEEDFKLYESGTVPYLFQGEDTNYHIIKSVTEAFINLSPKETKLLYDVITDACLIAENKKPLVFRESAYSFSDPEEKGYLKDLITERLFNTDYSDSDKFEKIDSSKLNAFDLIENICSGLELCYHFNFPPADALSPENHFYIVPETETSKNIEAIPTWVMELIDRKENGEAYPSGGFRLSGEDLRLYRNFLDENNIKELSDSSEPYFSDSPVFGIPTEVCDITVKTWNKEEAISRAGTTFLTSMEKVLPEHKNNPMSVMKKLLTEMKTENPARHEKILSFFKNQGLDSSEKYKAFFEKRFNLKQSDVKSPSLDNTKNKEKDFDIGR